MVNAGRDISAADNQHQIPPRLAVIQTPAMLAVMQIPQPVRDLRACQTICGELMHFLVVFDLVDQRRAPLPRLPLGKMRR